jgi:hypothetical protein
MNGIKNAVNTLETLLKVKPPSGIFNLIELLEIENISIWNKSFLGKGPNIDISALGIDLIVFAKFENSLNMGEGLIASASARNLASKNGQPLTGVITINKDIDYSKNNSLRFFTTVILHEMTHVLGFSNFFF